MAATLSSSLPFPTTITHSIPSLHSAFVTSVAPSFRGKDLCFRSARKVFAHFPGRSFRTNRLSTWAAEDEEANPVEETPGDGGDGGGEGSAEQPTVSVPVSASDTLTMFFQRSSSDSVDSCPIVSNLNGVRRTQRSPCGGPEVKAQINLGFDVLLSPFCSQIIPLLQHNYTTI